MKIGSLLIKNRVFLAPMAGITDLPYRLVMKRFGAGLVFTEMVSANGLHYGGAGTEDLLRSCPEERPLGVQLFGEDPVRLAEATRRVEESADLIDLNLGCPVKKVVRSGAGSALLREPVKIGKILQAMRRATSLPLTVKLRSGWDNDSLNVGQIARLAEQEGVDAITLHPRTRKQMFSGRADREQIMALKTEVSIPVIGSGDLFSCGDAKTLFEGTGCDAVMVARGGYGNPWLIRQILDTMAGRTVCQPSDVERLAVAREHFDLFLATFGPQKTLAQMRKHLCWYTKGMADSANFRAAINRAESIEAMRRQLMDFCRQAA